MLCRAEGQTAVHLRSVRDQVCSNNGREQTFIYFRPDLYLRPSYHITIPPV